MNRKRLIAAIILSLGLHAAILSLSVRFDSSGIEAPVPRPILAVTFRETEQASTETPLLEESSPSEQVGAVSGSEKPDSSSVEPVVASDAAEATEKLTPAASEGNYRDTPARASDVSAKPAVSSALTSPPFVTEPVPLGDLNPEYPMMARRMGLEGTVVLILTIDENGRAIDHQILEPRAPRLLEDAAIDVAMSASYQPGTRDAMPVSDTLRLRIVFRLET